MKPGINYPGLCVVFFCHDGQGNLLWQKRSANCRNEQNKWDVGGGAVLHSEKTHQAMAREVREEYCAEIVEVELLGHREEIFDEHHWVAFDWLVRVDPSTVRIGDAAMIDEIKWLPHGTLPDGELYTTVPRALSLYAVRDGREDDVMFQSLEVPADSVEKYVERVRATIPTKRGREKYDGGTARREYLLACLHDLSSVTVGQWDGGVPAFRKTVH